MHEEDLRHVWVCHQCQQCFIFNDDKENHIRITGHKEFGEYDLAELFDRHEGTNNIQHRQYKQDGEDSR